MVKLNRAGRRALAERDSREQLPLSLGTKELASAYAQLDALADDEMSGVEEKRVRYAALRHQTAVSALALAADLFVGAFLMPKQLAAGELALTDRQAAARYPTTTTMLMALVGSLAATHPAAMAAQSSCAVSRVLHWPLAFPQVFARGGFDVVLGNPPWERIKLQEQEFFAQRAPRVSAANNKAEREREIAKLAAAAPGTPQRAAYDAFVHAKQLSDSSAVFCRETARYSLTGAGDINTYALFAETGARVTAAEGRMGMVLPLGIVTDDSTQAFFEEMASKGRIRSVTSFENEEFIFPAVHHAFRFCLLTLGGTRSPEPARLVFFARRPDQAGDSRRAFSLSAEDFLLLNPNTKTCPVFRSGHDARLTSKIHRAVPVFIRELDDDFGNAWAVTLRRMLHMAMDASTFVSAPSKGMRPVYEAKFIHQFDHRWASFDSSAANTLESFELSDDEKSDPSRTTVPRYWAPEGEIESRLDSLGWKHQWLIGWRDITGIEKIRTVIASVMPRVGVGHTVPLIFSTASAAHQACLLANLNSLTLDYLARQKVGGTHLTYGYLKQLPILPPGAYDDSVRSFIVSRVLELTYTARDLVGWARDLGYNGPPFRWNRDRRAVLRAELDAWYAQAYGLSRDELRYVLDPSDVMGADWPSETFRVLKNNEMREFGEYRTRRLVLAAFDSLSVAPNAVPADVPAVLRAPLLAKPEVEQSVELALGIWALVREAGDSIAVSELTHALILRNNPTMLSAFAPPELAAAAKAWCDHATYAKLPGGAIPHALEQLVARQGLRWAVEGTERFVAATEYTPTIEQIHQWFRFEAALTLRVLRAMPVIEAGRLEGLGAMEGGASSTARTA